MKIKRILFCIAIAFGFFPTIAIAQSFWLHHSIGAGGYFVALDSSDCIMANHPDFEVLTHDYWNSWSLVIDSSDKSMDQGTTFGGFVHPSRNLLIAGYTDYYGAGHLVRSIDEGKTWTDSAIGIAIKSGGPVNSVRAMAAMDSIHIVALVAADTYYFPDHMMVSSDGGGNWQSVSTPRFQYYQPSTGLPSNPVVSYSAPNTLLVASIYGYYDYSTIYRTTDLGISWDSGIQANTTITKFAFINPLVGFASGILYDLSAGTDTATIDKTTDGGATWFPVLHKQIIPISTSYFNNTAGLNSIAFADSLHGFACGEQGLILQTTDGGNTWNEMRSDFTIDAQGVDHLIDVAYPDTNHAMISSGDGSVLVYHPNGILGFPNITYPIFSPPAAPQAFDVTWDSVPGATRYSITITTSGYPDSNTTVYLKDTNITMAHFHLSNMVDTSPPPASGGRQYQIYLQAFNATNQSNVATRTFIVYQGTNGVAILPAPVPLVEVYPNPARDVLNVEGFSGKVTVVDALGRMYLCPRQNGTLNVRGLSSGIYFISDGMSRAKFVKE